MDKLLVTYSLLGYLKETSSSKAAITELYSPLVKKALSQYASEHGLLEYKGQSLKEISDKVFSIFDIRIPLAILGKILEAIEQEIDDQNVFALYKDGAFIIKSYVFNSIDELFELEKQNIELLETDYKSYCVDNGYDYNFEELKTFILAQQIELFTDSKSDLLDLNYFVPKYVSKKMQDSSIFTVMSKIYLGCNQVYDLCRQLGYKFTMLYSTYDQIQVLLSNRINDFANKDYIGTVKCADVFSACIRRNIDKTALERIKDNVYKMIEDKGIIIIKEANQEMIILIHFH